MDITLSALTQNNRVCGFLFTSNEIDSLQQFKEAVLNNEASIDYSNPDRKLLVVINGETIQSSSLSNRENKKIYGFLCKKPTLSIGETGKETSFALVTDVYRATESAGIAFSITVEIPINELIAA